jgi:hypothetical protein
MATGNTLSRSLHDVGLAAWFGGSLMGAVGVNGAAGEVDDPRQRARVANEGWAKWTPVNLAAIAAHLLGGAGLTWGNRGRISGQQGVTGATMVKGGLMVAALGATAYARALGQKVIEAGDVPVEGGTQPSEATPPEVEQAQNQLHMLQWAIPALTGAMLVVGALMGEQQRPTRVARGMLSRALPGR